MDADDWADRWAMQSWWQGAIGEFIEISPIILLTWYAVNLPLLFNKPQLNNEAPSGDPDGEPGEESPEQQNKQRLLDALYEGLPQVLGNDIVAISSDLHYLNVHTRLGKTLVLGSLKHYADAFGETGMLVHRSHWVAKDHVVSANIASKEAFCLMSTGLKVPVSRSKRKDVKAFFGQGRVSRQPLQLMRIK